MFGLTLLAACRPAQEDWLKERSSTPPVSRTMHAVRAAFPAEDTADAAEDTVEAPAEIAEAAEEAAEATADGRDGPLEAPPSLFDPHAVSASAAAPTRAMACMLFFTNSSSCRSGPAVRQGSYVGGHPCRPVPRARRCASI